MAYSDRRQNASFRGVGFFWDGNTRRGGRRIAKRELAGQDGSRQQDHKLKPREFDVEAYLHGENFDADRDELEAALEQEGPGPLVLPYRGEQWVRITEGPETIETNRQLGYCRIRFSFVVEDLEAGSLRTRTDTQGALKFAAANLRIAEEADFNDSFDTRGLPRGYLDSTNAALNTAVDTLRTITARVDSTLALADAPTQAINELALTGNTLLSAPSSAATKLIAAARATVGVFDTISSNIDRTTGLPEMVVSEFARSNSVRSTLRAAERISQLGQGLRLLGATTFARREYENTRAVFRLVRAEAIARSAETFARAPIDSSSLALDALETLVAEIDALSVFGAGDELFQALNDTRAALAAHLTQSASTLPNAIVVTRQQPTPAVFLAYDLYGDTRRDADLIARNQPPYPLFMSGEIEALES